MGLLKFTKDYTSSDDGKKLTGTELGVVQADIAAVINGGITNANVSASAAIVESKLAFDTSSGHNHDGSNSRTLSSGAFRGFIQGAELVWDSAATVHAGSGVMDIAGTLYTRTSVSSTLNMVTDGDWVEGTSQEAANQWIYVYAYNSSGSLWDIKFWLQAPQYADTGTDNASTALIFRNDGTKWYRCLGRVRNNAGSDIIPFQNIGNLMYLRDVDITFTMGNAAAFTEIDLTSVCSAIDSEALLGSSSDANTAVVKFRNASSSTGTNGGWYNLDNANAIYTIGWFPINAGTTYTKAIDYGMPTGLGTLTGYIIATKMSVR
jgi:hypothetical protein